jgi:hypothetical protein
MLEVSAVLVLFLLGMKEFMGVSDGWSRLANLFYLPAIPLLVLFAISASEGIARIPSLVS